MRKKKVKDKFYKPYRLNQRNFWSSLNIFWLIQTFLDWLEIAKSCKGPFKYYVSKEVGGSGVRKWQFLLIYSTIYADIGGWVGLKSQKHAEVKLEFSIQIVVKITIEF